MAILLFLILTRQEHSITDVIFYIKPFDKITHNYSAKCPRKPIKAKFLPFGCITLLFLRPSVQVKYGQAVIVHLASAAALAVSLPAFTAGGRALCTLHSCTPAASWREEEGFILAHSVRRQDSLSGTLECRSGISRDVCQWC